MVNPIDHPTPDLRPTEQPQTPLHDPRRAAGEGPCRVVPEPVGSHAPIHRRRRVGVRAARRTGSHHGDLEPHVVNHAGRTLALVETALPYEIDLELCTLGAYDFGGQLANSMTTHQKICPTTGELHFFGYGSRTEPYMTSIASL
ncbi:MAG: carotenoid oxygenase family protein [Pseudonocardiaceae bacterium]